MHLDNREEAGALGDLHTEGKRQAAGTNNMQGLSDEALVQRYLQGKVDAFRILLERYETRVRAHARRYIDNKTDADELAQEAFITASQKLWLLSNGQSFAKWLFLITTNKCLDQLQRIPKARHLDSDLNPPGYPGDSKP